MTPLVTTVISCEVRSVTRDATIAQLVLEGLRPVPFLSPCTPAGNRQNAIVSARALNYALDHDADLLFCEDDIDLSPDFGRFLELARRAQRVTYFYLHDIPHAMSARYGLALTQAILQGQPIPAGLHELQDRHNLGGAQCVYLPLAFLRSAGVGVLADNSIPIDNWLSHELRARPEAPLVALPHPVQHRQVRVARANPDAKSVDKHSRSFDLERRWST